MTRMVPVLVFVAAVAAVAVGSLFYQQLNRVDAEQTARFTAEQHQVVARNPPAVGATQDNGWRCLDAMLKVSPKRFGSFSAEHERELEPVLSGATPVTASLEEELGALTAFTNALRECTNSTRLAPDADLFMWANGNDERVRALAPALDALRLHALVESRLMREREAWSPLLGRCAQLWALSADLTHLGVDGAPFAAKLVAQTFPACIAGLAKVPADGRKPLGLEWTAMTHRVASADELLRFERARQLERLVPPPRGLQEKRTLRALDDAFTHERWGDVTGVDLTTTLAARTAVDELLTLAVALAMSDSAPRAHVTRTGATVTWEGPNGPVTVTAP